MNVTTSGKLTLYPARGFVTKTASQKQVAWYQTSAGPATLKPPEERDHVRALVRHTRLTLGGVLTVGLAL